MANPLPLNTAFMRLSKRAESQDPATLVQTFVDNGPLFTLLSRADHQIIYGRRGTGKTHALSYLAAKQRDAGDCVVQLDLRTIGSTGGLYGDITLPVPERATRLLADTLVAFHEALLGFFIQFAEELNLSAAGPHLDSFAKAATEVSVVGPAEIERTNESGIADRREESLHLDVGANALNSGASSKRSTEFNKTDANRLLQKGEIRHRVHFGSVGRSIENLTALLGGRRIWLLLDEWSSVPVDLQPFLADLLRRSVFPLRSCTVVIAAIEQRSRFKLAASNGDYTGIELGADASADLNFDDFMVFEHDATRAKQFFRELLFKHVGALVDTETMPANAVELVRAAFTQAPVFEEFVRAAEGVPRDAINIITLAAQRALEEPISMTHIRGAARDWYQRDKEAAVRANARAHELLHWVIEKVIGERHARAFLLRSDVAHVLIDSLFDSRVLHILKRNIAAHDQPGIRYDAYKLDYGCYVDLISTVKAPQGLLLAEDPSGANTFVEVPPDDYRAIRRAILDLSLFEQQVATPSTSPRSAVTT